jgi:hypothetical protein
MRTAGGTVESYTVNGQSQMKTDIPGGSPGWHCMGIPAMGGAPDPSKIQGTVDAARGPDSVIEGEPVHAYTYTFQMAGHAMKQTVYVGAASGLPRRVVVAMPIPAGEQTMDYYDYGAPIQFNVPACT